MSTKLNVQRGRDRRCRGRETSRRTAGSRGTRANTTSTRRRSDSLTASQARASMRRGEMQQQVGQPPRRSAAARSSPPPRPGRSGTPRPDSPADHSADQPTSTADQLEQPDERRGRDPLGENGRVVEFSINHERSTVRSTLGLPASDHARGRDGPRSRGRSSGTGLPASWSDCPSSAARRLCALDDRADLRLRGRRSSPRGADLGHVAHLQQAVDAAQLLQLALVQEWRCGRRRPARRPAGGCTSGPSCPASLEVEDQVLHLAACRSGPGRWSARRAGSAPGSLISAWARPMRRVMPLEYSLQLPPLGPRPGRPCSISSAVRCRRTSAGHVEQPAVEVERLLGVEEAVQVRLLGQVADPLVLGDVGGVAAEDQGLAAGGKEQPQEQLDRGRLARAVGAQQAEDLAAADLQVEGLQGPDLLPAPEIAIDLGEVAGFDRRRRLGMRSPRRYARRRPR